MNPKYHEEQKQKGKWQSDFYGNFSGLVSDNETEDAQPLVKPNDKAISKNTNGPIRLIVVTWDLSNDEHPYSPRQDQPQNKPGYALTDDKMHEILQNQTIWKQIVQEVK
ncbi:MAG: hypothetical protein WCR50_08940 [Proteiniphilum sp.]|nr:hypothetical protein [Proteiniphilum sp.]MDD3957168.1 hypothetical protein [Proteiniphilum sp.]MDD4453635.1 hypothetical protein [Proteiniphilum sp.]